MKSPMTQEEFVKRYTYDPINDLLGEGGFGRVYRAYDKYEHEYVALKIQSVNPHYPHLRLRNEVDKVQCHLHKNIARYKGCYTFTDYRGDTDIAVMKYYKDGSLDKLMATGRLTMDERYALLIEILEGLAYLHGEGIIHRDLKPQNILIVEFGGVYSPLITDFGISKQLDDGESSAVSNSVLGGTRAYASPEQLAEKNIRKNTDLWSFGVLAYQMLTGELPFNSGSFSPTSDEGHQEQSRQMRSGILPELLCSVAEPWQRLIRECLVVDNTKRLAHVEDCLAILDGGVGKGSLVAETQLEEVVAKQPEVKPRSDQQPPLPPAQPPKPDAESKRQSKRNKWLWLLLLVTIIGGLMWTTVDVLFNTTTSGPYKVGDYYNENGRRGVVFEVWDGGRHGKIVSLDETKGVWDSRVTWDGGYKNGTRTYADSKSDGKANTDKIMARSDSDYFPPFKWCRAKGSSWYLPAVDELKKIYNNKSVLNATLQKYGATLDKSWWYWSSTEYVDKMPEFCAWSVDMDGGDTDNDGKSFNYYVRAVSAF